MKKSLLILVLFMQQNCYASQTNNHSKELQDAEIQEIEERQKYTFGAHLEKTFKGNIIEFLVATSYLEPYQQKLAEKAFNQACKNFHAQKSDSKIDPANCASVQEYLEKLKNTR